MGSDRTVERRRFLVVLDAGQGDVWAFVDAESGDQIARRYPELRVYAKRPPHVSSERYAALLSADARKFGDIDDDDFWLFKALRSGRPTK